MQLLAVLSCKYFVLHSRNRLDIATLYLMVMPKLACYSAIGHSMIIIGILSCIILESNGKKY